METPAFSGTIPRLTTAQMIEVDRLMIEKYKIDLVQMMENAGRNLARLAQESGVGGVVASVQEAATIKEAVGSDLLVVTPGIRLAGDDAHDQARVSTPAEAVAAGADYLVVGRSVTAAPDPVEAMRRVCEEAAGPSAVEVA